MGNKKLVIVESPTKAKTIRKFLDKDFIVESCMGHIRDLPQSAKDIPAKFKKEKWAQLGVNVTKNFSPIYLIPKDKVKVVKNLKDKLAESAELYLATDEDREGESISWHLFEVLNPKVPVKRMVFNEITKNAIKKSLTETREIDLNLVRAQEARRILDRLVGYTISPLLWKKIAFGLSAGRVQSVAVRLIVERESERMYFSRTQYWDVKAKAQNLDTHPLSFEARLLEWDQKKVAQSQDFNSKTGELKKGNAVWLFTEPEAQQVAQYIKGHAWKVAEVEEKPLHRRPMAPFITSTLQQEASRKLGMTARETMQVAQKLYEQGFITYMRTDSTFLSQEAIQGARRKAQELYGAAYVPEQPRYFEAKKVKGAQEAHEAIRPAGGDFVEPEATGLSGAQFKLYDMIWKRTLASQMADSRQKQVLVKIQVGDRARLSTSGMTIEFPGFLRAYVEGSDDPQQELDQKEVRLPQLKSGQELKCLSAESIKHETKPPARFTEASLVQLLEKEGIGRPSTYASIMGTIVDRGYIRRESNTLIPTFTAFVVTELLRRYLSPFVDVGFTSEMENALDAVASGELDSESYLEKIYTSPDKGLKPMVDLQDKQIESGQARGIRFAHLPGCEFRVGKYGSYVALLKEDGTEVSATIPDNQAPADVRLEMVLQWIENKEKGADSLGLDPESGLPLYVLGGRYGYYVQRGDIGDDKQKPKRVSLPPNLSPEQVTLPIAIQLIQLPKTLGLHPDSQKPVQVSIGRFGPYIACDGEFRSVPKEINFLELSFQEALDIFNQPKGQGKGRRKKVVLKDLGLHPKDQKPVQIFAGPYGPYVNWGKANASLPAQTEIASVTLTQALEWIENKLKSS